MKRALYLLPMLVILILSCSLPQFARQGGSRPQQGQTPPGQSLPAPLADTPAQGQTGAANGKAALLYEITEQKLSKYPGKSADCYSLSFVRFLDGGIVQPDGSTNRILEQKDFPTSQVTSQKEGRYFYISSPNDPVQETFGMSFFYWDVAGQTLWSAAMGGKDTAVLASSTVDTIPGGAAAGPGNASLVYPLTSIDRNRKPSTPGFYVSRLNPFTSDSTLVINHPGGGEVKTLAGAYNRQLFSSFSDFSPSGDAFYTIAREGESFKFVKVNTTDGKVEDFKIAFPGFDWGSLKWDDFFPENGGFSFAYFFISPDGKRMAAYRDGADVITGENCFTQGNHTLWLFNLENNTLVRRDKQPGSVYEITWEPSSVRFALALSTNSGCYPGYLDAWIDVLDRDGKNAVKVVSEPRSKITNLAWSPDGTTIAYDTYTEDLVGRIKLVEPDSKKVSEVINSAKLDYKATADRPVTLLLAGWVLP